LSWAHKEPWYSSVRGELTSPVEQLHLPCPQSNKHIQNHTAKNIVMIHIKMHQMVSDTWKGCIGKLGRYNDHRDCICWVLRETAENPVTQNCLLVACFDLKNDDMENQLLGITPVERYKHQAYTGDDITVNYCYVQNLTMAKPKTSNMSWSWVASDVNIYLQ
jgi:hypothetical protein